MQSKVIKSNINVRITVPYTNIYQTFILIFKFLFIIFVLKILYNYLFFKKTKNSSDTLVYALVYTRYTLVYTKCTLLWTPMYTLICIRM